MYTVSPRIQAALDNADRMREHSIQTRISALPRRIDIPQAHHVFDPTTVPPPTSNDIQAHHHCGMTPQMLKTLVREGQTGSPLSHRDFLEANSAIRQTSAEPKYNNIPERLQEELGVELHWLAALVETMMPETLRNLGSQAQRLSMDDFRHFEQHGGAPHGLRVVTNDMLAHINNGAPGACITHNTAETLKAQMRHLCHMRGPVVPHKCTAKSASVFGFVGNGVNIALAESADKRRLFLAFGGSFTEGGGGKHWAANIANAVGAGSKLHNTAAEVAAMCKTYADATDRELVLIGHSLGGGMAQYAGALTGCTTVGFSSAGLGSRQLAKAEAHLRQSCHRENLNPEEARASVEKRLANIHNVVMEGDMVSKTGTLLGTNSVIPRDHPSAKLPGMAHLRMQAGLRAAMVTPLQHRVQAGSMTEVHRG